jgi:MFS family permease
MTEGSQRTRITFRYELWRAATAGILETAGSTWLLTIAVKHFSAGAMAKAVVAGSGSLGLILSPLVVSAVTAAGWPPSQAAARLLALGAISFFCTTLLPGLPVFVVCSLLGMTASAAIIPLLTQMYQDNYPERERGRLFSRSVMVRIAMAAAFSHLAGQALDGHIERYPWLLLTFGLSLAFACFCLSRCPTQPIPRDGGAHPLRALRFVRDDLLFRRTLICWMLMGFANLMMLPLRVEYGVIPNLARLVLSPVWGYCFDRMNFFVLRMTLNVGFATGILAFFLTDSMTGMILGAIVFGISNAGGDVAWSLWVTKFAPPGRVADYMSVHTSLTGVRGVLAPMAAFYGVQHLAPGVLAGLSAGLILVATALLLPEVRAGHRGQRAPALVEEVSD